MAITDKQLKFSFLREYHLILADFDVILGFIDPSNENFETFSHRIYELYLRSCTALEAVFKRILHEADYQPSHQRLDIEDYFIVNSTNKLNEYETRLDSWRSCEYKLKPFEAWDSTNYVPLGWYQSYNNVKHDRDQNFKEANLRNLIMSIGGLFVLLYSEFSKDVFGQYQETPMYHTSDDGFVHSNDSIFSIKPLA
jgi:hypothetical protein